MDDTGDAVVSVPTNPLRFSGLRSMVPFGQWRIKRSRAVSEVDAMLTAASFPGEPQDIIEWERKALWAVRLKASGTLESEILRTQSACNRNFILFCICMLSPAFLCSVGTFSMSIAVLTAVMVMVFFFSIARMCTLDARANNIIKHKSLAFYDTLPLSIHHLLSTEGIVLPEKLLTACTSIECAGIDISSKAASMSPSDQVGLMRLVGRLQLVEPRTDLSRTVVSLDGDTVELLDRLVEHLVPTPAPAHPLLQDTIVKV